MQVLATLSFPQYAFNIEEKAGKTCIYDTIRRKWLVLTPEEWVRQHTVNYLVNELGYPASLIHIEGGLTLNGTQKRFDILLYDNTGKPMLLVECKAPSVKISQAVFNQAARYNMVYKVPYIFVTNGLQHFCAQVNFTTNQVAFIPQVPPYNHQPNKTDENET